MEASPPGDAVERLLTALEYGTRKEDKEFSAKLFEQFGLERLKKAELARQIVASPGWERFFLAVATASRPFALMLKEVYTLLSRFSATAEQRASVFRVSGADARSAFDFDLEGFPREVLRWVGQIEAVKTVFELRFAPPDEGRAPLRWNRSATQALWNAIEPRWDGDFYDDGFHRLLSYAGSILPRASPDVKSRTQELVQPIVDRLLALTQMPSWDDLSVEQRLVETVANSYMNGAHEKLVLRRHREMNSRLNREQATDYFTRGLQADDDYLSLSGPTDTIVWHRMARSILAMGITADLWLRVAPRKDRDDWLAKRLRKPVADATGEDYLAALEPLANAFLESLEALMAPVSQEPTVQVREALIEFLGLPFWKDRWFLYELWTLCWVLTKAGARWPVILRGVEARKDGVIEWKLPGGSASVPVASIGVGAEIECWSQRKTLHPGTGAGLEPDLRLMRSTGDHADLMIIENKDRRRPRTSDMAEVLERYVTGTSARCVCLINYETFTGPTHRLPAAPDQEVLIVSQFRPPHPPPELAARLAQIFIDELGAPAQPQPAPALPATATSELIEITLEWTEFPGDLDLHVWLTRAAERAHVFYSNKGTLDGPPFAQLGGDVTRGPGRELIKVRTASLAGLSIAVHQFAGPGQVSASGARVRIEGVRGAPISFVVPSGGAGNWWHVANVGADFSIQSVGVVRGSPPSD